MKDVNNERSTTSTGFSQESNTHLQTESLLYCFPSCPLWILSKCSLWQDRVCYADAGQRRSAYSLRFCQSSAGKKKEKKCCLVNILLDALVNKILDVFIFFQCPSGHHMGRSYYCQTATGIHFIHSYLSITVMEYTLHYTCIYSLVACH